MLCPYCQTENRDDREICYYCNKDLTMLRLIINKAKHHYNQGLEHAERGRLDDAIIELKNALELDGTIVNAYVVLGTLYMKKEQFEQAREAWGQALGLDHRYEKAHQYLEKSERAEHVFPAIKRLKAISAGLGVLLLIFAVYAFSQQANRRDPQVGNVRLALQLAAENPPQFDKALKQLDTVLSQKGLQERAREFATAARKNIAARQDEIRRTAQREQELALSHAALALNQNAPWAAWQILTEYGTKGGDAADPKVKELRDSTVRTLLAQLDREAEQVRAGEKSVADFRADAGRFMSIFASGPENARVASLVKQVEDGRRARVLADAGALAASGAPIDEAIPKLAALREGSPELASQINEFMQRRLDEETARFAANLDPWVREGKEQEALRQAQTLVTLHQTAGLKPPDGLEQQIAAAVAERDRQRALAEAQAAFAAKQWRRFAELANDPARLTPDAGEQQKLAGMRDEALRRAAEAQWAWMDQRDNKFEDLRISADEATTTVQTFESTLEHLPKSLSHAKAPILFYAASAYLKLNQPARARELLARIEREYPKSFINRSVKKFSRRFAHQLQADAQA